MIKTHGEIEAAICAGINRFEQEYRGRGPKEIHAYLIGDFVVVRLRGLLTPAEQQLAKSPSEKGRANTLQIKGTFLLPEYADKRRLRRTHISAAHSSGTCICKINLSVSFSFRPLTAPNALDS